MEFSPIIWINPYQQVDSGAIIDVLQKQLRLKIIMFNRPTYCKPYLEWIDTITALPKECELRDFSIFSSDDDTIDIEYVGRFTAQCKELEDGEFDKLQLYPLSLTGVAFSSYTNLFLNSVLTWEVMEKLFHEAYARYLNCRSV